MKRTFKVAAPALRHARASSRRGPALALRALIVVALAGCAATASPHRHAHDGSHIAASPAVAAVGLIVAAPDRGFLGNEEVRDAVAELAKTHNTEIVFVTDERTKDSLRSAVDAVRGRGATRAVLVPLFLSASDPHLATVQRLVAAGRWAVPLTVGRPFIDSYLAVELLSDRFRAIPDGAGRRVVVVGYGARDEATRSAMAAELQRVAAAAASGLGFESVKVIVWLDHAAEADRVAGTSLEQALQGPRPTVVPFELGPKMDSMMAFTTSLAGDIGKAPMTPSVTPDPLVALWVAREANRHVALEADDIGVVFLAHGSDFHWNDTMRRAVDAVAGRHKLELAFSMADQPVVERAVRRLESRGARAIVVVRVFGLRSSFQGAVERMLGLDVEGPARGEDHAQGHGGHGHGHGHGPAGPPPGRIRSSALFATVGGLEDSPLFARALLDRALALSKDPGRETVVLVAHGAGADTANDHWRGLLASLAKQMRAGRGAAFRDIKFGTWREDWPDKREPEIAAIRAMVQEAARDGGRAIVIPARTTAEGPEKELLHDLSFVLGQGFAPHPLFDEWFEEQIRAGVAALQTPASPPPAPHSEHSHHEHH